MATGDLHVCQAGEGILDPLGQVLLLQSLFDDPGRCCPCHILKVTDEGQGASVSLESHERGCGALSVLWLLDPSIR